MIFREPMLAKVLDGTKTVTRRPAHRDEAARCHYRVGSAYAIQPGRGRFAVGRLRVVDVRREPLAFIDDEDARREGFEDRAAFFAYWTELYYGANPRLARHDRLAPVWRIEFQLVDVYPAERVEASDQRGTPPTRNAIP